MCHLCHHGGRVNNHWPRGGRPPSPSSLFIGGVKGGVKADGGVLRVSTTDDMSREKRRWEEKEVGKGVESYSEEGGKGFYSRSCATWICWGTKRFPSIYDLRVLQHFLRVFKGETVERRTLWISPPSPAPVWASSRGRKVMFIPTSTHHPPITRQLPPPIVA